MPSIMRSLLKRADEMRRVAIAEDCPEKCVEVLMGFLEKNLEESRRRPTLPRPQGGITLREAERKYGLHRSTLSGWRKNGWITTLLETPGKVYLNEKEILKIAKEKDGLKRGSRSMSNKLKKGEIN